MHLQAVHFQERVSNLAGKKLKKACSGVKIVLLILTFLNVVTANSNPGVMEKVKKGTTKFLGRITVSAWEAVKSPYVWAPAAGAAVISLSGVDDDISQWASRTNPVFGSKANASRTSDILRDISRVASASSVGLNLLFAKNFQALQIPALQTAAAYGAITINDDITCFSKTHVGRERPDSDDTRSFPSGHTSTAAVNNMLAAKNIEQLNIPKPNLYLLQGGLAAMTAATGWARIEGKHHYPTDVLIGAALGNFMGIFLTELFVPSWEEQRIKVSYDSEKKSVGVGIESDF